MPRYAKDSLKSALYADIKREAKADPMRAIKREAWENERRNSRVSRAHRLDHLTREAKQHAREHVPGPVHLSSREVQIILELIEAKMGTNFTAGGFPVTGSEWIPLIRKLFQA